MTKTTTQLKNKVIVTGGLGYIGSHTVVQLLESKYDVVVLDDLSNSDRSMFDKIYNITECGFTGNTKTLTEFERWSRTIEFKSEFVNMDDVLAIIHFAAYKSVGESMKEPIKYYDNNINSLLAVLKLMNRFDIPNLIFSSSCTVYGQPDVLPITESSPILDAASPYGATKQMCERILDDYSFSYQDRNVVSLRYFNPIGAHPSGLIGELPPNNPDNLVPFLTQVAAGLRPELKVFGNDYNTPDGTCIRDYIHVCDLAQAHLDTLSWLKEKTGCKEVFNVGTGQGNSVLELIETFEKVTDVKLNWSFTDRRPGDIEKIWADNTKIKSVVGWQPKFNLEDSLRHAWRWQINTRS